MYIALIFITLQFVLIIFNIINNKKISFLSTIFLLLCIGYYISYNLNNEIYNFLIKNINNINLYFKLTCIIALIISFIEYIINYKKSNNKQNITNKKEEINCVKLNKNNNELNIYIELLEEPIAILNNNNYILNNKMKKILNCNNNIIEFNNMTSFINDKDKNVFLKKENNNTFKFINNDKIFECSSITINNCLYQIIRQASNERIHKKINLKSYKDLNNDIKGLNKDDKTYYLIFIYIKNSKNIINQYNKDYLDFTISKYLLDLYNIPYIFNVKLYYISKVEYVILIEDTIEYNSILSEIEDNISIILQDELNINNEIITVFSNVSIIASDVINNKNDIINKGYEILNISKSDDYPGNYIIYQEETEEIDFNILDLDINMYKKRLQ